jgi:hypothetical protein
MRSSRNTWKNKRHYLAVEARAMKSKLFAAAMVAACVSIATADDRPVHITGPIQNSCGTWTQMRNTQQAQAYEYWVLGFLSGANFHEGNTDFLQGLDINAAKAWMDNYCRAKPLDTLTVAMVALMQELMDRVTRK